jgi:glycerol-3-phosphate acyltransferase PlsY
MEIEIIIGVAMISYLIGALSFSRIITRLVNPKADLNNVTLSSGDGASDTQLRHMGATTASIQLGARWGCFIGWMDILKVAVPTLVIKLLYPEQPYYLIAAIFGMIGHNWPVYYKFKGGAGISAIYGGALVIDFVGAIVCAVLGMLLGFVVVKDILIAYFSGPWLLIPWFWFVRRDPYLVAYAVIVNIIFILAMIPEIRDHIRARREGKIELNSAMESFPMGRGMKQIMTRLRLSK